MNECEQITEGHNRIRKAKLYKKNQGLLSMSKQQLHDFASTKRSNLPMKAKRG